jgi:thioredoxin-dependent peroxiredoxin
MSEVSLNVGQLAPDFQLPDQQGQTHRLSGYRGWWVLVYFYPKDDTPGCTKEACTIRDSWSKFGQHGVLVMGISADSVESHRKFADKHHLPFTLLSDEEKLTIQAYGAWQEKSLFGKKYMGIQRCSFLVDPEGKIAKIYPDVTPASHADEVLSDIAVLQQGAV